MAMLSAILLLALSRAEIIERFRASPVTQASGLVRVVGDCPADMRREFQMPIAGFVSGVCRQLYRAERMQEVRFEDPGIVVYLGDVRTNVADVVARTKRREDGSQYTRMYLPAPGYSDVERLRRETVKAFYLAVKGETMDDAAAERALRVADPELRVADEYARLAAWQAGGRVDGDDEELIQLARTVLCPGVARPEDVTRFASRLYLYPETYSSPFCGKYDGISFRAAIKLAARDARIRFIALAKSPQLVAYGGGRGEELAAASAAYSDFLRELAAYRKTEPELESLLDAADVKLNVAMEEARKRAEGSIQ